MALGDYILCNRCNCKLIYDGDEGNREWWVERFGKEPEILCPPCQQEMAMARVQLLGQVMDDVRTRSPQQPVARVTGYYGGRCVIEPLDGKSVFPTGMAVYTRGMRDLSVAEITELSIKPENYPRHAFARAIIAAVRGNA